MSQRREVNCTVHTWEAVWEGMLELREQTWKIARLVGTTGCGNFPARGRISAPRCWRGLEGKRLLSDGELTLHKATFPQFQCNYEDEFWDLCTPLWAQQKVRVCHGRELTWRARSLVQLFVHAFGLFSVGNSAGRDGTRESSEMG